MSELDSKLGRCFRAVFTSISDEAVTEATPETVEEWDSIALVTLVTLVEDEFGIDVESDDLESLTSYAAFAEYIAARA